MNKTAQVRNSASIFLEVHNVFADVFCYLITFKIQMVGNIFPSINYHQAQFAFKVNCA